MTQVTGGCHCDKKGFVLAFLPRPDFRLTAGEDAFTTQHFNRGTIDHNFCTTCGTRAFGIGIGPDGKEMAAINLRCVDGPDRSKITIHPINVKEF